jgi:hypothetical protein
MTRAIAIACVLAGLTGGAEARPRMVRMVKGPYLQELAPTSITVMWQLDRAKPARLVVDGPGGTREQEVAAARLAEATITGLQPSSRYRYRVIVDDGSWEGQFATAPPIGKDVPLTFAVIGDTRYGTEPHRRVVDRIAREAPDFVLGTGDIVDDGARQDQWQQFFDVEGPLLRGTVLFPAIGNHDRQGRGRTVDSYRSYFSMPEDGGDERYYAFTHATSRFLVLDSNVHSFALTDQTAWIERELVAARQDPGVRHIFVVMHHPPFSISLHGGAKELRERWTPLFARYGVAAVFSGHDHVYTRAEHDGVRYFVTGGGGAPLYPRRPRPHPIDVAAVQRFERAFHYLRVAVTGRRVEVTGVRIDGTAIEATAWTAAAPAPPPRPPPRQPVTVEVGAPRPASPASPAIPAIQAPSGPVPGDGPPYLWISLCAVGSLLAAAVVVVRTLRR